MLLFLSLSYFILFYFSAVTSVAFSADGNTMVTGGRDRVINIWNLTTYSLIRTIPVYEDINSVVFLPKGTVFPIGEKLEVKQFESLFSIGISILV